MAARTRVVNLDRLKARIAAMAPAARAEIRKALETGGEEWVRMARQMTPVDQGDLRDSRRHAPGPHEMSEKLVSGDARAFYAAMVEFGTVRTPAQPSHVPAYRLLRKRIKGRLKRAVKRAARTAAGGGR